MVHRLAARAAPFIHQIRTRKRRLVSDGGHLAVQSALVLLVVIAVAAILGAFLIFHVLPEPAAG